MLTVAPLLNPEPVTVMVMPALPWLVLSEMDAVDEEDVGAVELVEVFSVMVNVVVA